DPRHPRVTLIYEPGAKESFEAAAATRDALVVTILDNVRGRAFVYRPQRDGRWKQTPLELPDNLTIRIVDASPHGNSAFLSVSGFLQPSSLWTLDAATNTVKQIKELPPKFDAARETVEQFEATSSDGTRVPYFVVHRQGMHPDGNSPTIINAYGGF